MAHGDWHWHELNSPDMGAASAFYAELFGWRWTSEDMGEFGHYHMFRQNGVEHGGGVEMKGEAWAGIPPHWMVHVEVDDCDAACDKIRSLGGAVKYDPFDIPEVGRMAVVADPQGAVFSIMTPASRG